MKMAAAAEKILDTAGQKAQVNGPAVMPWTGIPLTLIGIGLCRCLSAQRGTS
jgi:hypothetical protein